MRKPNNKEIIEALAIAGVITGCVVSTSGLALPPILMTAAASIFGINATTIASNFGSEVLKAFAGISGDIVANKIVESFDESSFTQENIDELAKFLEENDIFAASLENTEILNEVRQLLTEERAVLNIMAEISDGRFEAIIGELWSISAKIDDLHALTREGFDNSERRLDEVISLIKGQDIPSGTVVFEKGSGQIKILFAKFEPVWKPDYIPGRHWAQIIANELGKLDDVKIIALSDIVFSSSEALNLMKEFEASMIIWGSVARDFIEFNIETEFETEIHTEKEWIKSEDDALSYSLYIENTNKIIPIMDLVIGVSKLINFEFEMAYDIFDEIIEHHSFDLDSATLAHTLYLRGISGFVKTWGTSGSFSPGMSSDVVRESESFIRDLETAWELDNRDYRHGLHVAQFYFMTTRSEEALQVLDEMLVTTENEVILYIKAMYLRLLKRYDESYTCINKALSINPDSIRSLIEYGNLVLSMNQGDFDKAIAAIERAIELCRGEENDEWLSNCHHVRGTLFRMVGYNNLAVQDFELAIKYDEKNTDSRYNLGCLYIDLGEFELARVQLSQLLQLNPADSGALDELVKVKQELNDPSIVDDYNSFFRHIAENYPTMWGGTLLIAINLSDDMPVSPETLSTAAAYCIEVGDNRIAILLLKYALEIEGDEPNWISNLGKAYQGEGEHLLAFEFFEKALMLALEQDSDYEQIAKLFINRAIGYHNLGFYDERDTDLENASYFYPAIEPLIVKTKIMLNLD